MHIPQWRRRAGLTALAVAMTATLVACVSESPDAPSESVQGGTLTLGTTDIVQFDPYRTNSRLHGYTFYNTLVEYDDNLNVRPSLASEWQISDDSLSVDITLVEATFHSGEPVTAEDVVAGVDRAKDPELGGSLVNPSSFISGAEAIDDRTVRVTFNSPAPIELVQDWMFSFPVVEAEFNNPEYLETATAGSGPFTLTEYSPGEQLVVDRFAEYWQEGLPLVDQIIFQLFDDNDSVVSALESGVIDGALNVPVPNQPRLEGAGFQTVAGPGVIDIVFLNPKSESFGDEDLRKVFLHVIDRERIIDQVLFGIGEPVYTTLLPTSPAFDESILENEASFDLDLARDLLDDLQGSKSGTCILGADPGNAQMAQIVQADLAEIGFDLQLESLEQAAYIERVVAGDFECAFAAQPSNLSSPSLMTVGGPMRVTETNVLWGADVPEDYRSGIELASTALTPSERENAFEALNAALLENAWALGVTSRPSFNSFNASVQDVQFSPRERAMFAYVNLSEQ